MSGLPGPQKVIFEYFLIEHQLTQINSTFFIYLMSKHAFLSNMHYYIKVHFPANAEISNFANDNIN